MTKIIIFVPTFNGTKFMQKIPKKILNGASSILHFLIVPIFFFLFTIYYKPYTMYQLLDMPETSFSFNATILFCIILVSISMTRVWLYLLGKYKNITRVIYITWCIGEVAIASMFSSLYIVLISAEPLAFYEVAGTLFINLLATCVFPYGFLWMGLELYSRNNDSPDAANDNSLIRFYDEYKKLKFVISPDAVIFIKSEENYVQINYLDQNRTKKHILRSSMRALEDTLSKHGLVRCHRSYFINPAFIKIVHRDASGQIVAELKQQGHEAIPISRKYQESITRLL